MANDISATEAACIFGLSGATLNSYVSRGFFQSNGALGRVPVLETRMSGISDGQLHYRGHNAVELADGHSLEQVAQLRWGPAELNPFEQALPEFREQAFLPVLAQHWLSSQTAVLPMAEQFHRQGARLMRLLAALLLNTEPSTLPLHQQMAQA